MLFGWMFHPIHFATGQLLFGIEVAASTALAVASYGAHYNTAT